MRVSKLKSYCKMAIVIRVQRKKLFVLLSLLVGINVLLFATYLNFGKLREFLGITYYCPHLDRSSCTKPDKLRLPGKKGEGVVLAYKTPPNTALYSPFDGSMMVFSKPFFIIKEKGKFIRLPGIIVYKLDDKGRAEYSVYFIARHNIKRDRMTKIVKKGEKIAEVIGSVYRGYSILVGANRFDRKVRKFVVDEELLDKIFLRAR